jgi:hypothetical protein
MPIPNQLMIATVHRPHPQAFSLGKKELEFLSPLSMGEGYGEG